ncbi:MAG: hypothetical protein V3T23_03040 [Nitrososphaerales archaeon]
MSRTITVKCNNPSGLCGHVNVFDESELVGEVPLVDKDGARRPPPPVTIDDNTFVKCEKCGYPVNCADATITD